ncbi:hypothetical protein TrRE_jg4194 [Triparma retinervis]|uniref:Uncharacterized protein n=1 Tax=Triparma retinervis TaxID=2557542 RepID=A0A9W6ZLD2_9STRA|nr:hypothetical protein TrRE_jg4194 [Triparma retinervis]
MAPKSAVEERSTVFQLRLTAYENRLESYDKLKEVFASVSGAIGKVADARTELLGEGAEGGGSKLLGRLEDTVTGVIKPSKALLADRTQKVKAVDKEVKNFDSLKSKAGKAASNEIKKQLKEAGKKGLDPPTETPEHAAEVASAAVEMPESLLDARETLKNTEKLVDESSLHYEERRIVDMQLFVEDFIRREIAWHAKALEILSPLIAEARRVDAKGAVGSFNTRLERGVDERDSQLWLVLLEQFLELHRKASVRHDGVRVDVEGVGEHPGLELRTNKEDSMKQ